MKLFSLAFSFLITLAASPAVLYGEIVEYYIGRDSLANIATGVYAGLANPNHNRLTFLYAHSYPDPALNLGGTTWTSNHYHSKGTYSYTGGVNLGVNTPFNDFNGTFGTSNILPESPLVNDIFARPGSGAFTGLFRTGFDNGTDFNNLRIRSVNSLDGFAPGTGEHFMFNSSSGRWAGLLGSSDVFLNLVSISSGLTVRDASGTILMDGAGDSINLGAGDSFDFTPVFAADSLGTYQAVFNVSSPGSGFADGGRFVFEVTAVPEPASLALLAIPVSGYAIRRYRRRKQAEVRSQDPSVQPVV